MRVILTFLLLSLMTLTATAQSQALPTADWYAVVWSRSEDTLHWISPNGEPAAIARPTLPDEAVNSNPQVRFSRDGRYLMLAAELSNGLNGIGIYDIQAGQFTQVHQAQPDEAIYLGLDHTTNAAMTQVAVGFASADFDNNAWRIIIFDLATGAALDVLDNETTSLEMNVEPSIPVVTYYDFDENIGQDVIHFKMIPKTASSSEIVPAFKWYPALDAPDDMGLSPYNHLDSDIDYATGEVILPYTNPEFASLPAPESGVNNNAIGRSIPALEDVPPTGVWVDGQRYLYSPLWANSGQWVVFFTEAGGQQVIAGWGVVPSAGAVNEKTFVPLPASTREVFGTSQGLLVVDVDNRVLHITSLEVLEGTLLYQSPSAQLTQVVYVSHVAGVFSLESVGQPQATTDIAEVDATAAPLQAEAEGEILCDGTLPSVLSVGSTAQVANTDGVPLRVRQNPGGAVLTEIVEGASFDVIGGPQCYDRYTWWQIQLPSGASGWSAEGDTDGYWVTVLSTPVPTATPMPTVTPTASPTPAPTQPPIDATQASAVGDANCSAAPETRIGVGMTVIVQAAGGTLAFRDNPLDGAPSAQLPDQMMLPVIGGPSCRAGYRQWFVRVTIDGVLRDGWVSEGTMTRYFLEPAG
jgi:hypothetical protein